MFYDMVLGGNKGVGDSFSAFPIIFASLAALLATEPCCDVRSTNTPFYLTIVLLLSAITFLHKQVRGFNHTHRISHDPFRSYTSSNIVLYGFILLILCVLSTPLYSGHEQNVFQSRKKTSLLVVFVALHWHPRLIFCGLCLALSSVYGWFSVILIDFTESLSSLPRSLFFSSGLCVPGMFGIESDVEDKYIYSGTGLCLS